MRLVNYNVHGAGEASVDLLVPEDKAGIAMLVY